MARLNIEDSLFSDSRFIDLCVRLKSEIKAIGWWVKVARLAQSYWKNGQELIPDSVYKFGKFPTALIDSGIIEKRENGYYLKGSEHFFAWIFSCVENGRKGGRPKKDIEIIEKHETHDITDGKPTRNLPTPSLSPTLINNKYIVGQADIVRIVNYLNEKSGKNFNATSKETVRLINARFKAGFTVEDFKKVIDIKIAQWGNNPEMAEYIRPITLFGTKFESYLNSGRLADNENDFEKRTLEHFKKLEREKHERTTSGAD